MTVPTPLDVAPIAPKPNPIRVQRACTSKVRYNTEARAHEGAMRRMLINADHPLRSYPCDFCAGFHLTSQETGRNNPVEAPALLAPADLRDVLGYGEFSGTKDRQFRRYLTDRRRRGTAVARRAAESEDRIDRLPTPNLASPEEIAAFFGTPTPLPTAYAPDRTSVRLAA